MKAQLPAESTAPPERACPEVEQQTGLMELLRPERIGVVLSEEFQLHPEQSTSAIVVHHPEAKYFAVGKLDREQVLDYSQRKGIDLKTAERWLAPNLAYESCRAS